MDKKELEELRALVKESLGEMSIDNEIDFEDSLNDYEDVGDEADELPMSAIDMPIQDKGIFSAMAAGENPEDFTGLVPQSAETDYYEGGYEDDASVSPGYFNEDEEIPMADIDMPIQDKALFSAMADEEVEDDMSDIAKYRRDKGGDYEGGYQDDVSVSPGYYTEEEIAEMVREGVEKLHRKALIENRIQQINDELNMMANPEAWDNARTEAKEQLKKKHVAWQEITTRGSLMSEGLTDKGVIAVQKWIDELDYRGAAKKMIDILLSKRIGLTSSDLGDTAIFANGLDTVEEFLIAGELDAAYDSAKETALEMIEDEGGGMMFERKVEGDLLSEMSFRDIEIPVVTPKDTATVEANAQWDKKQKESVAEIMGRAADLMAEAKKKYNNISK